MNKSLCHQGFEKNRRTNFDIFQKGSFLIGHNPPFYLPYTLTPSIVDASRWLRWYKKDIWSLSDTVQHTLLFLPPTSVGTESVPSLSVFNNTMKFLSLIAYALESKDVRCKTLPSHETRHSGVYTLLFCWCSLNHSLVLRYSDPCYSRLN